jgi:hypothetical protein
MGDLGIVATSVVAAELHSGSSDLDKAAYLGRVTALQHRAHSFVTELQATGTRSHSVSRSVPWLVRFKKPTLSVRTISLYDKGRGELRFHPSLEDAPVHGH